MNEEDEEDERNFDDLENEENLKDSNGVTDDVTLGMKNKKGGKKNTIGQLDIKKGDTEEKKEEEVKREFVNKEPLKYFQKSSGKDGTSFDFDYCQGERFGQFLPINEYEDLYYTSCEETEDTIERQEDREYESDQDDYDEHDHIIRCSTENESKDQFFQKKIESSGNMISPIQLNPHKKQKTGKTTTKSVLSFEDDDDDDDENEDLFGSISTDSSSFSSEKKRKASEMKSSNPLSPPKWDVMSNKSSSEGVINNLEVTSNLTKIEESKKNKVFHKSRQQRRREYYNCFGCSYQDPDKISVDKTMIAELMQNMCRLLGKMPVYQLAKIIHIFFMKKIWHPKMNEGMRLPIWRSWQIYDHIRHHVSDPRFFIISSMEKFKIDEANLRSMSYKYVRSADGQEYPMVDNDKYKLYLETHKMIISLYKLRPSSLNFYNDNLPINMDEIGSSISLTKNFVAKKNYHNH